MLDESRALSIVHMPIETVVLGKKYLGSNQEHKCRDLVHADAVRKYENFGFTMSWHPSELCLAVPADKGSICLFRKRITGGKWEEEPLVFASEGSDLQHTDIINIVRFSPNGKYLASADIAGTVLIWDMVEKNPISKLICAGISGSTPLFDLQWGQSAEDNYIIVVTATSCGKVDHVIDTSSAVGPAASLPVQVAPAAQILSPVAQKTAPKPILSPPPADFPSTEEKHKRIKKLGGIKDDAANNSDDDLFADDAADVSIEAIKHESMQIAVDDDKDGDPKVKLENDYIEDADGFVDNQKFPYAVQGGYSDAVVSYLHDPIAPGSTPFDEKNRRYMCWNLVGSVVCREEESGNRIEIKFADTSGSNKNFSFVDSEDFKLAALSYEGAFFANQPEDPEIDDLTGLPIGNNPNTSDKKGSDIRYHAFPGQTQLQGANETFSMTLPVGEIVDSLAVGMGWAAVSTSRNLLRIFSSTGMQLSMTWLHGSVVCMTGYGPQLAVVYNDGSSLSDGSPNLAVEMFCISVAGIRQETSVKVPVTPGGSLLQWAGFSEDEILFVMDTAGMLSGLMRIPGGWQWMPLLDTSKASKKIDHKFWPVCVKSSNLCYVLLNGESKPAVFPQPVVSVKPLNPPIVEVYDSRENKEKAEAENTRNCNLLLEYFALRHLDGQVSAAHDLDELADVEEVLRQKKNDADKVLLQMFQESCRLQRNAVSSDIALRLHTAKALEIAIQIANHFKRPGLARLLENVLIQKQEDEYADQQATASQDKQTSMNPPLHTKTNIMPPLISEHTPPREYPNYRQSTEGDSFESRGPDTYDRVSDPAVVTPGDKPVFKKRNLLNSQNSSKQVDAPVNKFAQAKNSFSSPSKKRPFSSHEELKKLRGSPSPLKKKPTLNVSFFADTLCNES